MLIVIVIVLAVVLLTTLDPSFPGYLVFTAGAPGFAIAIQGRLRSVRSRAEATSYLVTDQRIIFVAHWPTAPSTAGRGG
ncbi:hypothetical protein [Amycolatopsis sp. NPDC051061]|uniref:hypothetical protein n=1 Tax=Amycolatopsis sp. NPDC051061 TaxID=3155042 RepID=UPI0034166DF5